MSRHLRILGTRGIPAAHGGFETFAERLALYLVTRGWRVTVYCQVEGSGDVHTDEWQGVQRVHIPVSLSGPKSTLAFDWKATRHAAARPGLCLTLGYNTAVFCALLRLRGHANVINMDGLEWQRAKWGPAQRAWLWLNERAGCQLGNHLIADHPEIANHLKRQVPASKVTVLPYGSETLRDVSAQPLLGLGLERGRYVSLIARPEPENTILEIVRGFSRRRRGVTLCVLGRYDDAVPYQRLVKQAAGPEVRFVGAIYDACVVGALRCHSMAYVHGHQVGGTNPSLVEALGAGNAVIAHDNRFNRWVAGDAGRYFKDEGQIAQCFDELLDNEAVLMELREQARIRHNAAFRWETILADYELFLRQQDKT